MVKKLKADDIREFFTGFAAAIELDQIRVDALPPVRFHAEYRDSMWRGWRDDHLKYLNQLLSTVDVIPHATLEKLTWIATNYEPEVAGEAARNVFSDAVSGSCPIEDLASATLFFECLIKYVMHSSERKPVDGDAAALMIRWLPVTDPLRIAEDPECGYGMPSGCVN